MSRPQTEPTPARLMRDAPELLRDLFDHASSLLRQNGLSAERADILALELVDIMTQGWRGQVISFPKGAAMRLLRRDLAIYRDFTGNNYDELAQKYDVTTRWVRHVVNRVKNDIRNDSQSELF